MIYLVVNENLIDEQDEILSICTNENRAKELKSELNKISEYSGSINIFEYDDSVMNTTFPSKKFYHTYKFDEVPFNIVN